MGLRRFHRDVAGNAFHGACMNRDLAFYCIGLFIRDPTVQENLMLPWASPMEVRP